ncbi:MAG: hypothetical protein H0X24_01745 [Ktedonobacterales bacterium]|nr:hypothetical protein [Ktedonobacterales bacterium]
MPEDEKQVTIDEIIVAVGAKYPSVKRALDEMNVVGKRDLSDRRRILYPASAIEKVRQWLHEHS